MSCIIWQRPVFTCIRQNIKWSLSHALLYSFIVFKYVILILQKDKYILGRIGLCFWGFGEKLNNFYGFGEQRQILLGRRSHYLQGDGEINALFSGIKGAPTPPGGPQVCMWFSYLNLRLILSFFPYCELWHFSGFTNINVQHVQNSFSFVLIILKLHLLSNVESKKS